MKVFSLIIPLLFSVVFVYAALKKVKVYDSFISGVKGAIPLLTSLFPYIVCVFLMTEIFEQSGLSGKIISFISPAFEFFGIPKEIVKLVLIKPFSGSGSTALLSEILNSYGADSYISRCACVCYGSSETVFYITAVYFSSVKEKKLTLPVTIALVTSFISTVFACLICRFL